MVRLFSNEASLRIKRKELHNSILSLQSIGRPCNMNAFLKRLMHIGDYKYLLVALFIMYVVQPFFPGNLGSVRVIDILMLAVILTGIMAIVDSMKIAVLALILVAIELIAIVASYFFENDWLLLVRSATSFSFLILTAVVVFSHVISSGKVTTNRIMGAACVYLMLGGIWAYFYSILEIFVPGSFHFSGAYGLVADRTHPGLPVFSYFSMVTLTTLGYGDITPANPQAAALATMEAIIGQLYIAIIIARLVGLQASESNSKAEKD